MPDSTSRSMDHRTAWIPCTTTAPACVLRAASGSMGIGLKSPDRRAQNTPHFPAQCFGRDGSHPLFLQPRPRHRDRLPPPPPPSPPHHPPFRPSVHPLLPL